MNPAAWFLRIDDGSDRPRHPLSNRFGTTRTIIQFPFRHISK